MDAIRQNLIRDLEYLRNNHPLIHNITNYVVMNYTANALLAMGASPVMAHAEEEVEEMVGLSSALVLNIGTLSNHWVDAMETAARAANRKGIPVVLDPVGAGATLLRRRAAKRLLENSKITVLRGNASEILSLAPEGATSTTKGVDSTQDSIRARNAAKEIARGMGLTVAVTGNVDVVTNGNQILYVHNGHPMMGKITGSGCTSSVVIGAFCAVQKDPIMAAVEGLAFFGIVGEVAAERAKLPGSYGIALLDGLAEVEEVHIMRKLNIQEK
jgi:hydroxyethylthiazole kinase